MTIIGTVSTGALTVGFKCRLKSMVVAVLNNGPAGSATADTAFDITRNSMQDEHAIKQPSAVCIGRVRVGLIGALNDAVTTTCFHFTDLNIILNKGDQIGFDGALAGMAIDVTLSVEPI